MEEQSRTYILEASDLSVSFETDAGEVQAVRDVSLSLNEGEVLATVGESGCGKSVLCKRRRRADMKYIAICGTVGAGKTTLLQRLTAYFGPRAAFHEERPQDNPYINEY